MKILLCIAIISLAAFSVCAQDVEKKEGTIKVKKSNSFVAVELEGMNVFYIGIPNPINIIPVENKIISVSISQGTIKRVEGTESSFIVNVSTQGEAIITVNENLPNGKTALLVKKKYRVKLIPNPIAKIANRTGRGISSTLLIAQAGIMADLENFEFEGVRFTVTSFDMTIAGKGKNTGSLISNTNLFTNEMKYNISQTKTGDIVIFDNIKCIGPDGGTRNISPVAFTIQ